MDFKEGILFKFNISKKQGWGEDDDGTVEGRIKSRKLGRLLNKVKDFQDLNCDHLWL